MALGNKGHLYYSTDGGLNYTAFSGLRGFQPAGPKYATVESNAIDADAVERECGKPDNQSVKFKLKWSSGNKTVLESLAGLQKFYKYTDVTGYGYTFEGFLTEFAENYEFNALHEFDCTIEITGALTPVSGS